MRIWPFAQIDDWLQWRRRERQETLVATWKGITTLERNQKPTGVVHTHIVSLYVNGNGNRYSRVESTDESCADTHSGVVQVRAYWRSHGNVPQSAWRANNAPRGKLVAFPGGKDGAA